MQEEADASSRDAGKGGGIDREELDELDEPDANELSTRLMTMKMMMIRVLGLVSRESVVRPEVLH